MEIAILSQADHRRAAGARLRRLLELLDLSQVEAAEIMGVTKQQVNNWLRGDAYPTHYALYRLSRLRGIDFNYVLGGDWSALPTRIGQQLEEEVIARLDAGAADSAAQVPLDDEMHEGQTTASSGTLPTKCIRSESQ